MASYLVLRGDTPEPEAVAHRGGTVATPENTMAAFRHAIELGVDYLEFDVQMTADGELVVIHDDLLDRTTDGEGPVGTRTLEELRVLDAGGGERIPSFAEIIDLARTHGIRIMPEAKSPELYPGMAETMVRLVEEKGYLDRTVFQSFSREALEEIRAVAPDAATCALTGLWDFDLGRIPATHVCPMAEMALLHPWMIRSAHAAGQHVYPYFAVLEHPLAMRAMLLLGVDGLIVDDPAALTALLGR